MGMGMDSSEWEMMKQAKEELQMLEFLYPNRFHYLKLELKSFISLLHSSSITTNPSSSMATTQGSTSKKRRKKGSDENEEMKEEELSSKHKCKRDRVDVVLDKAQSCLLKIREVKKCLLQWQDCNIIKHCQT